MIRFAGNKV